MTQDSAQRPEPAASNSKRPIALLTLLLLSVLTVYIGISLRQTSGPYWLSSNLDPSYAYLMNSLNVANLHRPYYFDHPGTPIHIIGGLVIRTMNLTASRDTTARNVLNDPERYVKTISTVLLVFCGLCVLVAGYVALKVTGSLLVALLIQSTPFLSTTTVGGLMGVRPEPLMIGISLLIAATALLTLKVEVEKYALRYVIAFGLLIGLGLAAKVNFAPVALVPLIVLPSWKNRLAFLVFVPAAFIAFISPLLTPAVLREMLNFMVSLATHTGRYGSGEEGFLDPRSYVFAAFNLIRGDVLVFVVILLSLVALLFKSKFLGAPKAKFRLLLGIVAAQVVQLLMVAKHPSSRYLIPSFALAGLSLALLTNVFGDRLRTKYRFALTIALCLTVALVQSWGIRNLFQATREDALFEWEAYQNLTTQFPNVPVVTYYMAASPHYALAYGSDYSGRIYGRLLQQLYPNNFFYSPWRAEFSTFAGPIELNQIVNPNSWFILRGCSLTDPTFKPFLPARPFPEQVTLERISGARVNPGPIDCDAIYKATVKSNN